jgi:hypothetical protein
MMKCAILSGSLVLSFCFAASAGSDVAVYVKDGALRTALIVREVQILPTGYVGSEVKIETDGKWTLSQYAGKKAVPKSKGQLPKEFLESLAEQLARYDLVTLRSYGTAGVNTYVVGVEFGRVNGILALPGNQRLPQPNAGDSATLAERYAGIVKAAQDIIQRRR